MDINRLLTELRAQRNRLDKAIAALSSLHGSSAGRTARRARRGISKAGRKRLSELMKKRWASGKMKGRRKAKAA